MDPALDILNRALTGDHAALSFLDRTSSIYVLDATDPTKPKTYGGWNFIHQAMNEVERHEASFARMGGNAGLNVHVQLLATIAQRVARRPPKIDRKLVATCVSNASQFQGNVAEAESLINLNSEIREIVMGRIAAMAFDFSFHNQNGMKGSAFSDPVTMEKLCSVLAANAVSSGPSSVSHFMNEWIIPSVKTLPPFAVACVAFHLALEAKSRYAPAGTKDTLQQLSHQVVSLVVAPVLADAIMESNESYGGESVHAWNSRVASIAIGALDRWCAVTDLSLAQIRHVCNKVNINVVEIVSDGLYSDSRLVIDALAELLEGCLKPCHDNMVSTDRMKQARYIMEVDEDSFRSVSREDIFRIESKEMDEVLGELILAVGLQRFRFAERQSSGDNAVCRSLTRIAVCVGTASLDKVASGQIQTSSNTLLELLLKAVANPSVHISGLAIEMLAKLVHLDTGLLFRLLPLLQHRAIVPYVMNGTAPSLGAAEVSGVNFPEFESFRGNVLNDALTACFLQNPNYYMDSCTSAIEEFCSSSSTVEVSFQLEAALFCLSSIAEEALKDSQGTNDKTTPSHEEQLRRCSDALSQKPQFLAANPLSLAQLNRFIGKYASWFSSSGKHKPLEIAFELCVSTITMAGGAFPVGEPAHDMIREMKTSPFAEAASALRSLIVLDPSNFVSQQCFSALGAVWEATYSASNQKGALTLNDRQSICVGICSAVAALPKDRWERSYHAFSIPTIGCLQAMSRLASEMTADGRNGTQSESVLMRLSDEIQLLATVVESFKTAEASLNSIETSTALIKAAWNDVNHIAMTYVGDKNVSNALGAWLVACSPTSITRDVDLSALRDLNGMALSIASVKQTCSLLSMYNFLDHCFGRYGEAIEEAAGAVLDGAPQSPSRPVQEAGKMLEQLLLVSIEATKSTLGTPWIRDNEQGQGQPAYESKTEPVPDQKATSMNELSSIFAVLTTCAKKCPIYLVHLPSANGVDPDHDRLFSRAIESAVATLSDTDPDASRSAILYLISITELMQSSSIPPSLIAMIEGVFSRHRRSIVSMLLEGACGVLHPSTLYPASSLLRSILRSSQSDEAEACCRVALQQEQFKLLGNHAEGLAAFLGRCMRGEIDEAQIGTLFEDLWRLYQTDDVECLSGSDELDQFSERYGKDQ